MENLYNVLCLGYIHVNIALKSASRADIVSLFFFLSELGALIKYLSSISGVT